MSKRQHPKPDDKEQSHVFIKKAREIGANEKRSEADNLLGRLARMPPKAHTTDKKPRSKR